MGNDTFVVTTVVTTCGFHLDMEMTCGYHLCGFHPPVVSTLPWLPPSCVYHAWLPPSCGYHSPMVTQWFPPSCGYHAGLPTLLWWLCGFNPPMVTTLPWWLCGYHPPVVTPWFPPSCGYHAWFPPSHGYHTSVVSLWLAFFWEPCLDCGLKLAWKWQLSWLPVVSIGETMLWLPFQSNLTPKSHDHPNQPIRSLNSLKSPRKLLNLWDFMRFHKKFFLHLKSKAVSTALLKMAKNHMVIVYFLLGCVEKMSVCICTSVCIANMSVP